MGDVPIREHGYQSDYPDHSDKYNIPRISDQLEQLKEAFDNLKLETQTKLSEEVNYSLLCINKTVINLIAGTRLL